MPRRNFELVIGAYERHGQDVCRVCATANGGTKITQAGHQPGMRVGTLVLAQAVGRAADSNAEVRRGGAGAGLMLLAVLWSDGNSI